jgi:hypothetical protein
VEKENQENNALPAAKFLTHLVRLSIVMKLGKRMEIIKTIL